MKYGATLRFADRATDLLVCGFALFTLAAHGAVFLFSAGLDALITSTAVLCAGIVLAWPLALFVHARWRRRASSRTVSHAERRTDSRFESSGRSTPEARAWPLWQTATIVLSAASAGLAHWLEADVTLVWSIAAATVAALAASAFVSSHGETRADLSTDAGHSSDSTAPARDRGATVALSLAALVCVAVVLFAHRPDADDAFYLNLAVAAVDSPDAPLLASDTLHGIPGVPIALPVYRVHSLELLEAVVSRVTGLPVLDVAHLWLPALVALFVPFALARLLLGLVPERFIAATLVATAFLAFSGGGSHGWQNFGLIRLQQGKAILLTLLLPLLAAYAIDFVQRPGGGRWLRLAAGQVAAVGLSASALWLAPLVAALASLAALPSDRPVAERARRFGGALASSGYVLLLALLLRAATEAAFRDAAVPGPEASASSVSLAHQAARAALGGGPMAAFMLFSGLAAGCFCKARTAQRFCALFAACWLLLWNPFTASFVAAHLTSPPTFWRVFWLVPMAPFVAIVLTAVASVAPPSQRWAGALLVGALTAAVFVGTPRHSTLSLANHVTLGPPGWKVPDTALDAALALRRYAGRGNAVLAPEGVAPWIVTLEGHPYPLVVRMPYLPALAAKLEPAAMRARVELFRLVSADARPPHAGALLRRAIADYDLRAVCLSRAAAAWDDVPDALALAGFQKVAENADYETWAPIADAIRGSEMREDPDPHSTREAL